MKKLTCTKVIKKTHKNGIVLALMILAFAFVISGCSSKEDEASDKFQAASPQPDWWDDVSTEGVTINTYDDLLTYWQNKERTNNQFFKAAYQAILDHPLNDDIVVNAINLMPTETGVILT